MMHRRVSVGEGYGAMEEVEYVIRTMLMMDGSNDSNVFFFLELFFKEFSKSVKISIDCRASSVRRRRPIWRRGLN